MLLFSLLLLTLVILGVILALALSVGGAAVILAFGDVIVCGFIIVWIMRKLIKRKK